jgi:hypothetical protein
VLAVGLAAWVGEFTLPPLYDEAEDGASQGADSFREAATLGQFDAGEGDG